MKLVDVSSKQLFISQLANAALKKLSPSEGKKFTSFLEQFFIGVFVEEYEGRKLSDVVGGVVSLWKFFVHLAPDESKVVIINPNLEEHGWQSSHTVLAVLLKNMPFVVDSIRIALNDHHFKVHGIQHSILYSQRSSAGALEGFTHRDDVGSSAEALMLVEIDRHTDLAELRTLKASLESVLQDIAVTVQDYEPMLERCKALAASLAAAANTEKDDLRRTELKDSSEFLSWLGDNSFTFLGYSEYTLAGKGATLALEQVDGSKLGIIKCYGDSGQKILLSSLPESARQKTLDSNMLIFAKSSRRSIVHRPAYPDYITIKQFNRSGEVVGECRFLGLFTARIFNQAPNTIPLLATKVTQVLGLSEFDPRDHSGKELLQLLAIYPRDELFQVEAHELHRVVLRTLHCQERRKICLFIRQDAFGRFLTALVYVPREIYNTSLREKVQSLLLEQTLGLDIE